MSAPQQPPAAIAALVQEWHDSGRPAQRAIPWPRERWLQHFPEREELLAPLPDELDRNHVRTAALDAAADPDRALAAFLVAMIWGYGRVGYGPWRTRRVLDHTSGAGEHLRRAAELVAEEGAVAGYRHLANDGRLAYLGPAFGTKLLHFVPQTPGGPRALIHDAVVSAAIRARGGPWFSPLAWRTPRYQSFLETLSRWADDLDIDPVDLEMLLFVAGAPEPGSPR